MQESGKSGCTLPSEQVNTSLCQWLDVPLRYKRQFLSAATANYAQCFCERESCGSGNNPRYLCTLRVFSPWSGAGQCAFCSRPTKDQFQPLLPPLPLFHHKASRRA